MDSIIYNSDITGTSPEQLNGFFVGWAKKPTPQKLLELLEKAPYKVIAMDQNTQQIVGFIYAITDGILCAYIPLLEVLPVFQKKGIGKNLVNKLLKLIDSYYMIDLCCDSNLEDYYRKLSFNKASGMIIRNYSTQSGI